MSYISLNNKILRTPSDITNAFNEYYTNIAVNLDNNIPTASVDPITFLRGDYPTSMSVPPVLPSDTTSVIKSLKNKKSSANEIPVNVIKGNCEQIAIPLSIIFNQSIERGIFPQTLKHATVIPIYKNGPKDKLGNYRPISLLSTFSKIFEKLMKKFLLNYLESKSIITPEQFGFRQCFSTFHALEILSENIYSALDSQHSQLSIFIDFCKAFDTVRHDILLQKLKHYGIRGVIFDWFKDYLSNRTQSTKILNHMSSPLNIKYGVPQGSVLGPILFLIYINDLPQIFPQLKSVLFADDSTLYITGDDPISMIETANSDLEILHNWCVSNRLTINSNKTYYMLFTNKPIDTLPPLKYDTSEIAKVLQYKMLGITFDERMTFKSHIANISHKLSRNISLLYQVKNFMPRNVLQIMYNAHILPYFQYCTPIWCNTYPTHLLTLFRLQKKIIRIISNHSYYEHTQPLFKNMNILKLFDINKLQIGIYMYKSVNRGNMTALLPQHDYPTRTREHLRVPQHSLSLFQHSLTYSGPKTWNSVPTHIQQLPTLRTFKKHYKQYILNQY